MAKKITELTELTTYATSDLLIIEDVSANTTKKITWANLIADSSITPEKLLAGTGTSWAWQSWTPTLTNLTLGNGTVTAKYRQIGKTVHFHFTFTWGTTSAVSGTPTFSLPVTAVAQNVYIIIGRCTLNDTGTRQFLGFVNQASTTTANIFAEASDVSFSYAFGITSTIPFTWTNTDVMTASGTYEAA